MPSVGRLKTGTTVTIVSVSQTEDRLTVILANPTMIDAFKAGVTGHVRDGQDRHT